MTIKKINVAVIGATGFTGLDLVYLLSKHNKVNIDYLCATKNLGKSINFFDKRIKKKLPKITSFKKVKWNKIDFVFLSLPNGESQKLIKKLYYNFQNIKFIDLSADYRIKNLKEYFENYKIKHLTPELIKDSIYSISEFTKNDLKNYRIIANPGCYPTSVQLAIIPLIKKRLINDNIIIDTKSGYSGAGKKLEKKFKHKHLYSSIYAYGINNHRHVVEINQEIKKYSKKKFNFSFNPYLLPTFRGILTAIYIKLKKKTSANMLRNELIRYYKNKKFIKILRLNSQMGTGNVLNTNNCEISICNTRNKNQIVIFSAIDNLVKGASGQAIQNFNIMNNFSETHGLK